LEEGRYMMEAESSEQEPVSSLPPREMKEYLKSRTFDVGGHFSNFVQQMTAFAVDAQLLEDYKIRIQEAFDGAKATGNPQVVDGESEFFMVIRPNGVVTWALAHKTFDLFTKDELQLAELKEEYAKGNISGEKFHELRKPLQESIKENEKR
jgi:hypothetical protein